MVYLSVDVCWWNFSECGGGIRSPQWRSQGGGAQRGHGLPLNFQLCDLKKIKFDRDLKHMLRNYFLLRNYIMLVLYALLSTCQYIEVIFGKLVTCDLL